MTIQHDDAAADGAAVLRPGRVPPAHRGANGRTALGRLQRQAIATGHLAPRQGVRDQLVLTALGRAVLERAATTDRPPNEQLDRLLRDHAGDNGLRWALVYGLGGILDLGGSDDPVPILPAAHARFCLAGVCRARNRGWQHPAD